MARRHQLFSLRAVSLLASGLALAAFGCGAEDAGDTEARPAAPPAPVQPSGTYGGVEGERPGRVAVSAVWLDANPGTTLDSSETLTARITNNTDTERAGKLALVASGLDGRLVERPVREFRLAPGKSEDVAVALSSLPIQSETSAPFVALEVQTDRADGGVSRVSSTPLYYLFRDGYRRVTLHGAMDVLTKLGSSALGEPLPVEGRVAQADGTWLTVGGAAASARGAPVRAGYGVRLVPKTELLARKPSPMPRAPDPSGEELLAAPNQDTMRVCATWRVQYNDAGFGEDDLATSAWQDLPARFARAWVRRSGSTTRLFDGQLDISGCTPALALDAGAYVLEYDTWDMKPDELRRFDVFNVGPDGLWHGVVTSVNFSSTGSGANTTLNFHPTFNDDAVQAAAIAAQVLGKDVAGPLFGAAGMGLNATVHILLANADCPEGGGSCFASDQIVYIGTDSAGGPHASHWKYIVAHEIGHSVQFAAMGQRAFNYDDTAPGASGAICRCDHYGPEFGNSHCIQSREISGAAQNEGFAHAFATRLFNAWLEQNATFVYYKPVLTFGITPPPMPVSVFQDYRWMENFCSAEGRGVELDWLNFFYRVSAEFAPNKTSFADLFMIYRRACNGNTTLPCFGQDPQWADLLNSARAFYGGSASDPRYVRFRDTGVAQGVDH